MRAHLAIALTALLLAGCGSTPPSHYYLLEASASSLPAGHSPTLGIGPIEIPEYVNRSGMVYNSGQQPLQISTYERWAEPLEAGILRVLSLNLASQVDTASIQAFPWSRADQPDYAVALRILSLDAGPGRARMVAEWTLQQREPNATLREISEFETALPGQFDPAALASAYSELLAQLSAEIGAELLKRQ